MKKKHSFMIASGVVLMFFMLVSNFVVVHATPATNTTLPDFLERILEASYPNATSSQLDQIRAEWANQLLIDQEHAPGSAEGMASPMIGERSGACLATVDKVEHTDAGQLIGQASAMTGWQDNVMCELFTPNYNDMIAVEGAMSSSLAWGQVYAYGCQTWGSQWYTGNYILCYASNSESLPHTQWTFIGYVQFVELSGNCYFIGYTAASYKYMSFGCMNMGGQDAYNDIYVDCGWTSFT